MNTSGKKKYRGLIIIVIILCTLFLFFVFIAPFLAIGFENILVQININNPYVNRNFDGWQSVSVPGFNGFCIPEGWSFHEDNGLYTITDETGQIWAYGAAFGTEDERFENYKALITEVSLACPIKLNFEPFPKCGIMDGSEIGKIVIQENEASKVCYNIRFFKDTQTELAWFLTVDISADQTQYEIAEAFIFSYAFNGW